MTDSEDRARRLILFAVAALIAGTAFAWSLYLVRDALSLVYLSGILALGFSPAVSWLERRRWFGEKRRMPRWLAVLLFYLAAALLILAVFEVIVPPFVAQATDLGTHLPEYVDKAQAWLVKHHLQRRAFTMAELLERGPNPNEALSGMLGAVNRIVGVVVGGFTVVLLSFYLLLDGESLFRLAVRALPKSERAPWWRIAENVGAKVSAWMSAQAMLCVLIGTTAGIGFWLIGLPYFYVLALICGIGELVPIVGPVIASVPAVIVASTIGLNTALITAAFLFVQQQVENNIIIPRLMKKQTGISPVFVMTAILIGGELMGIIGALLAVPTAAVVQILVREYLDHRDAA